MWCNDKGSGQIALLICSVQLQRYYQITGLMLNPVMTQPVPSFIHSNIYAAAILPRL